MDGKMHGSMRVCRYQSKDRLPRTTRKEKHRSCCLRPDLLPNHNNLRASPQWLGNHGSFSEDILLLTVYKSQARLL
jgi:hypothetical protein